LRSLFITRHGGPEVLQVREVPDPTPGPGEVRVRVARAGLNFAEIAARLGLYPDAPRPPTVVGYEVAGTVDTVGRGVESVAKGDRVLALTRFGGHSDLVVTPAGSVLRLPEGMSFDQAAALPVNYLTAYHILFHVHALKPGQKVLVHMAAGGVGHAAIQLARTVPDIELFGTASASKHARLREWGVHHPIDYRSKDYAEEVRRLTGGRGVDLVLDPLGGPDWAKGYALLRPAGHLICYGWANLVGGQRRSLLRVAGQFLLAKRFSPPALISENRTVSGVNLGHLWGEKALLAGHLRKLLELYSKGEVRPHVDQVFPLSEGAAAHRYLQERKNVGKVLFDCTR